MLLTIFTTHPLLKSIASCYLSCKAYYGYGLEAVFEKSSRSSSSKFKVVIDIIMVSEINLIIKLSYNKIIN